MSDKKPDVRSNKLIDTKDIMFVWKLILKNILLLIIVPILAYLIGYVYTYRLSYVYGAKSQLLLKSNETYDYQDPIYKGLGAYGVYMDVQNQMRILKSRDLIGEVIDKIHINTSYYVVGRIIKHEVFETLPFKADVEILNNMMYEIPVQIKILNKDEYELTYELNGQTITKQYFFDQELSTPDFNVNLLRRYTFKDENIKDIMSSDYEVVFHSRNYLIGKYQGAMSVENLEHTSILEVNVTDELPQRAKVFLDTLMHSYIEYSKRVQLEVNQNTLDNIQKQIDTVQQFIEQKERELIFYKDQKSIIDIDKEYDEFFNEYIKYTKQKRELERKKSSVRALKEYLLAGEDSRLLPPHFYIEESDQYLADVIEKIRSKQVDIEIKKANVSPDNPVVLELKKEIALLESDVLDYLKNIEVALDQEIKTTDDMIFVYRGEIQSLPKSAQEISNIQRELDVNNKMYVFLLEKQTNTLIARAGIIPQVRIIENTQSLGVVEPNKSKIKRLFFLGGLIFAMFLALVRKLFFEKIENVSALSEVTNLNIVGGIPFVKKMEKSVVVEDQPKSHVTESFRTIRTNLSFMGVTDSDSRTILISSFYPGEGKTFCSSNLATLIARGDKKVILIDLDLHRPKVHKVFDMDNDKGVSSYIIGKATMEEIVRKNESGTLDVVTAGPIAPNPSELVLKKEINDMIEWAQKNYEYVIIDTPPFGLLNDTLELVKKSDTFLVVLNTRYTRKRGIQHIEETLERFEDVSTGVMLNSIRESKIQYYYSKYTYRYTYGYNYGYGYGYDGGYTQERDDY